MGQFFGFKLHLPSSHQGQAMAFKITGDNTDDRQPLQRITTALRAKGVGDKDTFPSAP